MNREEELMLRGTARLMWIGLCGIALVLLLPNPGHLEGQTFYQIARNSAWDNWFDWPAVWCSIKVTLLCVSLLLSMASLGLHLMQLGRTTVAWVVMVLSVAATVGVWLGLYFLVKAFF
ncbi:MAG: hypothetical protein ABSG59_12955 [Verrucomicrobiota bacterium]|jgi:hypothetical protein